MMKTRIKAAAAPPIINAVKRKKEKKSSKIYDESNISFILFQHIYLFDNNSISLFTVSHLKYLLV